MCLFLRRHNVAWLVGQLRGCKMETESGQRQRSNKQQRKRSYTFNNVLNLQFGFDLFTLVAVIFFFLVVCCSCTRMVGCLVTDMTVDLSTSIE